MAKVSLSVIAIIKKLNKKYIAAYLAKKANPRKIPNNKKFFNDPADLILKRATIDKVQNNKSKRSVDIKKDETLAAGIDKKQTEQITELFFEKFNSKHSI